MILIDDIIISDDVIEKQFVCNLKACKGACCVEGDTGAPLEAAEVELLKSNIDKILPFLTEEGREAIMAQGVYLEEPEDEYTGLATTLINGQACAYVNYLEDGTATCGIENAWEAGAIDFRKPISCHLYPVRVKNYDAITAVNFDDWEICDPACALGKELQVPVYVFVKDALIRKFGEPFYEVLLQAAEEHHRTE
jgi:Protein of unknown function (DUF3109)